MSVDRMNASALWNYAAYAEIPQDGLRHEIIGGEHYVNPAPNTYHQQISRRIQFQLYDQLELTGVAQVFDAPVDLELSDGDIVQPDLLVISRAKYSMITLSKIVGVPDLIVEIVSPSNKDHDLRIKRGLYERMGVPEFWIVLPDEQQVLKCILSSGSYQEETHMQKIMTTLEPHAVVDLTKVW